MTIRLSHPGFLQAITREPKEKIHRLVYSDWLEENEQREFATSWRLQDLPRRLGTGVGTGTGTGDGVGGGTGTGTGDGDGTGTGVGGGDGGGDGVGDGDGDGVGVGDGDGGGGGDGTGTGVGGGDGGGDGVGVGVGVGGGVGTKGEKIMPSVGDKVFLHARGSFYPYAWCGRIKEILTPNSFVLEQASLLPSTRESDVTWVQIAEGNNRARAAVRIRVHAKPVEVYDVSYCEPWEGELPTKDQH